MPNNVVREFVIRVNSKGQVEAIRDYEKLDATLTKTERSAGATNRALKASGGAAKNATSSFAKQAQGLGGLVHVYATVAANVFALGAAFNILKRNADLEILYKSSQQLSVATGQNFNGLAESLVKVTGGAITFRDAMQSANLALSGGFSGKQANQIAEIATKAANALGRSVPEAVQRLTQAIVKGEPELADEFGIILRVTEATNEYAKALGKVPTELTTAQRQQAIFNQFLEQGTQKFANVEIQTNPYDKLAASFQEVSNKVLEFIRLPIDPIINLLSESGLALASVFAAIAGGIAKLLLPQLRNLSANMVKVANIAKEDAFAKYTASAQAADIAQKRLNDDLYDYVNLLQTGVKKSKLDKIDLGSFDSDQLARELDKSSGNVGLEVRKNILNNVFQGDDTTMRKVVGNFVKGLESEVSKATAKGFKNVDFRGFTGTLQEARVHIEALGIATKTQAQLENEAATSSEANTNRRITRWRQLTAEVNKYAYSVKAATASGYAKGLETGFLKSVIELKSTFIDINNEIGAKGVGKLAGFFGAGAKLAGGFIGGVTKLAGIFGQIGIVIATLSVVLGPILGLLGIFSDETKAISDAMEKVEEDTELYTDQLKKLKDTGKTTFEDVVKGAKLATNIANELETQAYELTSAFKAFDEQSQTLWGKFTLGASDAVELISILVSKFQQLKGVVPTGAIEKFDKATEFTNIKIGTKNEEGNYLLSTGARGLLNVTPEEYAKAFNLQNAGSGIVAKVNGDTVEIQVKTAVIATEAGQRQVLNLQVYSEAAANMQQINEGFNKTISAGSTVTTTATKSTVQLENSLSELSSTLSDNIIKLNNTGQAYNGVVDTLRRFEDIAESGGDISEIIEKLSPELIGLLEVVNGIEIDPKKLSSTELEKGLTNVKTRMEEIAEAESKTAAESAKLNAELIKVSEQAKNGNIAAISEEYRVQRDLLTEQIKLENAKIGAIDLTLAQAIKTNKESAKVRQLEQEKLVHEQKILELKTKQEVVYSDIKASEKISVETAKARQQIAGTMVASLEAQASELDKIAAITGNTSDLLKRLDFEDKITQAKKVQLSATIRLKEAEASGKTGEVLNVLNAEIAALRIKLGLVDKIAALEKIQKASDARQADIAFINKQKETGLKLDELSLQYAKGKAELLASDKFVSTEVRDAAKLKALQDDIGLAHNATATAVEKVAAINRSIVDQEQVIKDLKDQGYNGEEGTRRLKELNLELSVAEEEARASTLDIEKAITAKREEQFQLAKKNANLFRDPKEFGNLLGEQFRRAAEDFGEKMGNTINQVVDVTLGSIDSGIDAFVDAVYAGENALEAAKNAVLDTFRELNTEIIKDIFKKTARDALSGIFSSLGLGGTFKNLGKSPELVVQEAQLVALEALVAQGSLPGGATMPPPAAPAQTTSMFDSITKFMSDTFTKVKDTFVQIGGDISKWVGTAFDSITDFLSSIDISGLFDTVSSVIGSIGSGLSGAAGGAMSGIGGLVSSAISFFFAKGGITGAMSKRIPMYANGGLTNGPELAMIGEGAKREAVVPLPDNKSIPVTIHGNPEKESITNNVNISITGVQGNEAGIKRSANQVGMQVSRALQQANRRNG